MGNDSFAEPGEIIEAWSQQEDRETRTIVLRTEHMVVMRLHLGSGVRIPTHEMQGEMTILCVQGCTAVTAMGQSHELKSGQLLYLLVEEPFELEAKEESSLLITILRGWQATVGGST